MKGIEETFKDYDARLKALGAVAEPLNYFHAGYLFGGQAEINRLNTPDIKDFICAVENEALHQRHRWGSKHDAGKTDADWFWLTGYLAGKAIRPDATPEKQLHHIITAAAAMMNWHSAKIGAHTAMRPGIDASNLSETT